PPPAPPRSAKRARLAKPRKKSKANPYRPVILGGAAFGAACLSLIVAAVIVKSGDRADPPPPTPVTAPAPAVEHKPAKAAPPTGRPTGAPRTHGTRPRP